MSDTSTKTETETKRYVPLTRAEMKALVREMVEELGSQDEMMTEIQAAKFTGLSVPTLREGRSNGHRPNRIETPPFYRIGRAVRYRRSELSRYLDSHRVEPKPFPPE